MDYEKAYKEMLGVVKELYPSMSDYQKEKFDGICSELKESEDERIRKFLLDYAIEMIAGLESDISLSTYDGIKGHDPDAEAELTQWQKARGYLEKQKEQKPAEWSDTDMKEARNNLISVCRDWECGKQTTLLPIVAIRARYFLEHLTEPKPAEWSEEDERNFYWISTTIQERHLTPEYTKQVHKILTWLKSLRPQPHWKPSEEQMRAVFDASERNDKLGSVLRNLYNDLRRNYL